MLNIYEGDICGDSFSIVDLSQGPKYTSDNNKVLPFIRSSKWIFNPVTS